MHLLAYGEIHFFLTVALLDWRLLRSGAPASKRDSACSRSYRFATFNRAHCGSLVWFTDIGIKRSEPKETLFRAFGEKAAAEDVAEIQPLSPEEFEQLQAMLKQKTPPRRCRKKLPRSWASCLGFETMGWSCISNRSAA